MKRREIKGEASIKDLALVARHKEVAAKVDNPIWPRSPTPITTEPPQPLLLTGQSCAFFQQPLLCFFLPFLPKCSRRDIHSYRCVSIVSVLRAKGNAARGLSSTQPAQISLHIGPILPRLQPTQPNSTPTNPTMPYIQPTQQNPCPKQPIQTQVTTKPAQSCSRSNLPHQIPPQTYQTPGCPTPFKGVSGIICHRQENHKLPCC